MRGLRSKRAPEKSLRRSMSKGGRTRFSGDGARADILLPGSVPCIRSAFNVRKDNVTFLYGQRLSIQFKIMRILNRDDVAPAEWGSYRHILSTDANFGNDNF